MVRVFIGGLAGLIFGIGLIISQMANPAKVLGFLDLFGRWDPSLAFVMGGAVVVTSIGYALVHRRDKPVLATFFDSSNQKAIDAKLCVGAVLFGIGWGLVGLCPGPALVALSIGGVEILGFVAAMLGGMAVHHLIFNRKPA